MEESRHETITSQYGTKGLAFALELILNDQDKSNRLQGEDRENYEEMVQDFLRSGLIERTEYGLALSESGYKIPGLDTNSIALRELRMAYDTGQVPPRHMAGVRDMLQQRPSGFPNNKFQNPNTIELSQEWDEPDLSVEKPLRERRII